MVQFAIHRRTKQANQLVWALAVYIRGSFIKNKAKTQSF